MLDNIRITDVNRREIESLLDDLICNNTRFNISTRINNRELDGIIDFVGNKLFILYDNLRQTRICIYYRDMIQFDIYLKDTQQLNCYKVV